MGCTVSKDRAIKQRQQNAKSKENSNKKDTPCLKSSSQPSKTLDVQPSDTNTMREMEKTQTESEPVKRCSKRLEPVPLSSHKNATIEVEKKSIPSVHLAPMSIIPKPHVGGTSVQISANLSEKLKRKEGKEHGKMESAEKREEQSVRDADEAKISEEDSPPKSVIPAEKERRERSAEKQRHERHSERQRNERVTEKQRQEKSPEKQTEPDDLRAVGSELPAKEGKKIVNPVHRTQSIDRQRERQRETQRHRSSRRFQSLEKPYAREHEPSHRRREMHGGDRPSYRNPNANAEMEREQLERDIKERIQTRQRHRASQPMEPEDDTLFEVPKRMPLVDFT